MRGYANKATGPARLHQLSGAALAAHARKAAKKGKRKGKKKAAKKSGKKKSGKKKAAKKAKGAGKPFRTKVQVGRRKVVVKAPAGATVMEMATARKDRKGHKHVKMVLAVVGGRKVRVPQR